MPAVSHFVKAMIVSPARKIEEPSNGETALWRAVIRQALDDSTLSDADAREFDRLRLPARVAKNRAEALQEAREWFDKGGDDFELVCELAGLSAPEVQRWALEEIRHFDRVVGDWRVALGAMMQ